MAFITLDISKLKSNFNYLDNLFKKNKIEWTIVTKILSGNIKYLTEILNLNINQVADSRVTNLKRIKSIKSDIETVYIKPPAKRSISNIVKYADISMNTEIETIKLLSKEAKKQNKIHKIIIMIELGELREGVMGDDLINFYEKVFELENIIVEGIGTNFSCLYGVLPNQDKLIQLSLYKQLIEAKFNRQIKYISGGSSVTIPLIIDKILPKAINHFRIGESLFLGTDVYNNSILKKMHSDVFKLFSEIIELIEKPTVPNGELGTNVEGISMEFEKSNIGEKSFRAIIDIGLLDVEKEHLELVDKNIKIVGASSDMMVLNLNDNKKKYKVGDLIEFKLDYMGILRIINSKYIEKKISH